MVRPNYAKRPLCLIPGAGHKESLKQGKKHNDNDAVN